MAASGQRAQVTEDVFTSQVLRPGRGRARVEGRKVPREMQVAPPWAGKSLAPGQLRWALGQGDPKPCFLGEP